MRLTLTLAEAASKAHWSSKANTDAIIYFVKDMCSYIVVKIPNLDG